MSEQERLFFEDANEALRFTVQRMGGTKVVGPQLRGDMSVESAQTWLDACLNPNNATRLDPEQVVALVLLARRKGIHSYAQYLMQVLGYEAPVPVSDERVQTVAIQGVAKAAIEFKNALKLAEGAGVDFEALARGA